MTPWLISAHGTTTEKMKAGEFVRKLKSAINDAGYTSNNVDIIKVCRVGAFDQDKSTFDVTLEANDGQVFSIYVEED